MFVATEYSWVNIFEARRSCPFPGGIKRLIIDVPEPTVELSRLIDFWSLRSSNWFWVNSIVRCLVSCFLLLLFVTRNCLLQWSRVARLGDLQVRYVRTYDLCTAYTGIVYTGIYMLPGRYPSTKRDTVGTSSKVEIRKLVQSCTEIRFWSYTGGLSEESLCLINPFPYFLKTEKQYHEQI